MLFSYSFRSGNTYRESCLVHRDGFGAMRLLGKVNVVEASSFGGVVLTGVLSGHDVAP